jgi:predicted glycosyltransferase
MKQYLFSSVSSEEQLVSSQESQSSLYTISTGSTEVDFDIMSPHVSRLVFKITLDNLFILLAIVFFQRGKY